VTQFKLAKALALSGLCLIASASGVAAKSQPPRQAQHRAQVKKPAIVIPAGIPKTVVIQKIGVKAPVESLDLTKKSEKDAPNRWGDVAWYNRGPRPGAVGRASIFGHLDSYCCPAVFWKLKYLRAGDQVQVYYKTGKALTFRVQWGNQYLNSKLPLKFMFGRTPERGLILMTCTGVFHKSSGYDRKWLVYARVVLANGKIG
jgi:sortase A